MICCGDEMESPADPYKVGYNFLGWAEEEGSTAVVVLPETMPAKNVDYYAVFEAIEYTITFANTGDTEMDAITLPYGTEIGEIAEPTKTGYTFAGWNWTKAADSSRRPLLFLSTKHTLANSDIENAFKISCVSIQFTPCFP